VRSVLSDRPDKGPAHGNALTQALEPTFGSASPFVLVPLTGAVDRMSLNNRQRRHCFDLVCGLSENGHPRDRDLAALLAEGARLRAGLDRRQEGLT
jgi:hypothetical protein